VKRNAEEERKESKCRKKKGKGGGGNPAVGIKTALAKKKIEAIKQTIDMKRTPLSVLLLSLLCLGAVVFATPEAAASAASDAEVDAGTLGQNAPRTCTLPVSVADVQLTSTAGAGPMSSASNDACLAACPLALGWLGATRKQSTGQCWCIRQPFGSPASGIYNTDFSAMFNPITPTYACASWTVAAQKWMFSTSFNSGTLGPFTTTDLANCASMCGASMKSAFTRQRSTGRCWCGTGSAWTSTPLLYDTDFDAGVQALF
jgi:hypothetical protein